MAMNYPAPSDPLSPQRQLPTPYKFSLEDERIIKECNREAFYQRCIPYATGMGGLAVLAVRAGYLKTHPTWGPTPKALVAIFMGYFIGKVSYQQICAEKLMANPNSEIGAALRARRQQGASTFQDALTLDMPGMTLPTDQHVYRDDLPRSTFTDLDTDRPYQGLDDVYQPNLDAPQRPEDFILPPQASAPNTYDDLRRKNREEYEKKMRIYRPPEEPQRQYSPAQPGSLSGSSPPPFERYQPTNVYGDVFEK